MVDAVEKAVEQLKSGKMIILTDNEDRENEGDIVVLADRIEASHIDFMTRHARGLICTAINSKKGKQLGLCPMTGRNTSSHETAFTISVDADNGSTGISVRDRLETIRILSCRNSKAEQLVSPGHMFPLLAKPGGLTEREGHTEAAVELARLCGAEPAAVICEILSAGENMAKGQELEDFAVEHGLLKISIAALKAKQYKPKADSNLPTKYGLFTIYTYPPEKHGEQPIVFLASETEPGNQGPYVRIHSECFTGDILGSRRCDCGEQLNRALEIIAARGGYLIYLRQEGRGIGLEEKIRAYKLQDQGEDTYSANLTLGHKPDERNYEAAAAILKNRRITRINLLTNNRDKISALTKNGISVTRIPLETDATPENIHYLKTKKARFKHLILQGE